MLLAPSSRLFAEAVNKAQHQCVGVPVDFIETGLGNRPIGVIQAVETGVGGPFLKSESQVERPWPGQKILSAEHDEKSLAVRIMLITPRMGQIVPQIQVPLRVEIRPVIFKTPEECDLFADFKGEVDSQGPSQEAS